MQQPISLMNLLEVGAHRGNSKSKLNPKLKTSVYGYKNGICLINLVDTIDQIDKVCDFMQKLGQKRKQILIVGTSKHVKDLVPEMASKFSGDSMPYVNNRWLGGTLTNWVTIKKTLKTLEKLENIINNKDFFNSLARNEQLNIIREKTKIYNLFAGLKNLKTRTPGAVLILDAPVNDNSIKESDFLGLPVIALTHTSIVTLPKTLNNTIVCNINSINTVTFITNRLIEAYNEGVAISAAKRTVENTDPKKIENSK